MAEILFIKMSSFGDVLHHMPALTEARANRPGDRFSWVVEEAFAPLVRLHPGVDAVIPVTMRRWRGLRLLSPVTWGEIARFRTALRAQSYDAVIDTQGLMKSAMITRQARGLKHGYDPQSITEPPASRFYDVRHRVEWNAHAIARNRALTGAALGYVPQGAPDYGLDRTRIAGAVERPYVVLLHATAHAVKEWPEQNWRMLALALGETIDVVLPWGNDAERARSIRIAAGVAHARVPDLLPIDAVMRLIAGASFVVGVDTGLLHVAAMLSVPLVAIFCGTDPALTGPMGTGPMAVLGNDGAPPSFDEVEHAIGQFSV